MIIGKKAVYIIVAVIITTSGLIGMGLGVYTAGIILDIIRDIITYIK